MDKSSHDCRVDKNVGDINPFKGLSRLLVVIVLAVTRTTLAA